MDDSRHDLNKFVSDETSENSVANTKTTQMMAASIPLSPVNEQPLAGENTDETQAINTIEERARRRPKSSSPGRQRNNRNAEGSKSPGTRRAVKKMVRVDGEEALDSKSGHGDEKKERLGSGSNHGRRKYGGGTSSGPRLSWKSDPRASFCDWRIEVHHMSNKGHNVGMDVYNVHRNVVGFGPRKSNYLVKEFLRQIDDRNYGSGANITKLELPFWHTEAFPMVLDFMYHTKEVKQTLTAERACSVFQIAELLDIRPLVDAIENFYQKTLSLKNMTEFMAAAKKAKADRLLFASRAKIGSLILEKPELAGLLLPKFMVDILEINRKQVQQIQANTPERYPDELRFSHSRIWSKAAFVCASHNTKYMTKEIFNAMTHEECLPAIDTSVAFKFLLLDGKFHPENVEYNSLQRRCVRSITDNREDFQKDYSSPEEMSREIYKLPSRVQTEILSTSMDP